MAAGSRTLKLSILADVDQLKKSLTGGAGDVQSFGDKIGKFGKLAGAAFLAVGVAAAAFTVKFAKDAIAAGEAAATANARIEQINKSMGLFGESTAEVNSRLIALAEATARQTGVDTNSIKATQAKLLTFKELAKTAGELGGQFDRATAAAVDLAAAGFGEASANAVQLGKALNDPIKGITALSRAGITFTEVEKEKIKALTESGQIIEAQNLILGALETQVGGTAEATANASEKIKIGFTQIQEKVGIALLPAFESVTSVLLDKVFPAFESISLKAAPFLAEAIAFLQPILENLVTFFQDTLIPAFKSFFSFIVDTLVPAIVDIFSPVLRGLFKAFDIIRKSVVENADELKPLLVIFGAIAVLVTKVLAPALGVVLGAALQVVAKAAAILLNIFSGVVAAISGIVNGIRSLISLLANPIIKGVGAVAGLFGGGRADGGAVTGGTSYLVGERGAEIFKPSSSGTIIPNRAMSGGGGTVINVNVTGAIDPEGVSRSIVNALNNSFYRGGGGGSNSLVTA